MAGGPGGARPPAGGHLVHEGLGDGVGGPGEEGARGDGVPAGPLHGPPLGGGGGAGPLEVALEGGQGGGGAGRG